MARMARLKVDEGMGWYHVHASVAAREGEYALNPLACKRKLIEIIEFYAKVYCCDVAGFCVMGNHYHLVTCFEQSRQLPIEELIKRAKRLYPNSTKQLKDWQDWQEAQWERLNERLFDLSEFMRNIQSAFARWYNRTHRRKGRFWGDRFKSTLLTTEHALLDCMMYVDLNPVRAGLCQRPETFKGSSLYYREIAKDKWLLPLSKVMNEPRAQALVTYKAHVYFRGTKPTKESARAIPDKVVEAEAQRGFKRKGVFLKKMRYFSDGLVVGSEAMIQTHLSRMRDTGQYLRRAHAIRPDHDIGHCILREQRSHFVALK